MKRILIFSLAYYPKYIGGAEIALREITDRVPPEEIEFDMITCRFDSLLPVYEKIGNINIYRIGPTKRAPTLDELQRLPMYLAKVIFPILAVWKAHKLDKKRPYDAVWAMMSYMGFPIVLWQRFFGRQIPFLLTLQEGDPADRITKRLRIRIVSSLYERVFKNATIVQSISYYLEHWARDMGYTGPVEVIPNAVDVGHFSEEFTEAELREVLMRLEKKQGERFVITTSRLVEKNGIDTVIRAMNFLPPNVRFLVLGIGPEEDALKNVAEREGVADKVMFLGQVGHADLPKYLKASDVFVRASRSEGMGNSFIEAMAAKLPVVATEVGGITDFVFDPDRNPDREPTGLYARVDDPADVAEKIMRFFSDPELRTRCITNAHRMVVVHYDWNLIARAMRQRVFLPLLGVGVERSTRPLDNQRIG